MEFGDDGTEVGFGAVGGLGRGLAEIEAVEDVVAGGVAGGGLGGWRKPDGAVAGEEEVGSAALDVGPLGLEPLEDDGVVVAGQRGRGGAGEGGECGGGDNQRAMGAHQAAPVCREMV
jgi:hypothetical protein